MTTRTIFPAGLLAAGLAFSGAAAAGVSMCDIDSDYDLRVHGGELEFSRSSGQPQRIAFRDGQLLVDGRAMAISAADADRVRRIERGIRELVPEVQAIAMDAVDLAFTAVSEVTIALVEPDDDRAIDILARMEETRDELRRGLSGEFDSARFDEDMIEEQVETLVGELVPLITAEATAVAVKVALSGDESAARELERRMSRMESELEGRVEAEAEALEVRAEALCPRIAALDAIEDEMEFRLADNRPLDLFSVDRD